MEGRVKPGIDAADGRTRLVLPWRPLQVRVIFNQFQLTAD
jgi:hypothetical protein